MPKIVISASRRTDIPAAYMPWFMECIERGHFDVINPYNRRKTKVPATIHSVHSIVFWSKNFGPFLKHGYGNELSRLGYRLFFNFTINSPHPALEPRMPPLEERLEQLKLLADTYGPESIQWRFDPICFYKDASGAEKNNLDQFEVIAHSAQKAGVQVCITSFADLYRKVRIRFERHSPLELVDSSMDRKVEIISALAAHLVPMGIQLHLCCEKEVLESMPTHVPVIASACIPSDKLIQLYGPGISWAKDKGQRIDAGCTCGVSKDIGSYALHPCDHNCLYCYARPAIDRSR